MRCFRFYIPAIAPLLASCATSQPTVDNDSEVAQIVAPGLISTREADEIKLAETPDGRQQVWGSVGRSGRGELDLWERHRMADGTWSRPAPLAINGPGEDFDPAFSPDGGKLYFHSDRPGGLGGTDIYVSDRTNAFEFSEPRNLGASIDSAGHEWAPWPLADGTLLFASDGWGGAGRHDLFHGNTKSEDGPRALGSAINGPLSEFDPALSADGRTLVFSRGLYGPDSEDFGVWRSDLLNGAWSKPIPLAIGCGTYTIGLAFLPGGDFSFSSRCPDPARASMVILRMSRDGLDSAS